MLPSDSKTARETLELGSTENMRLHPEGKNKNLALHRQGKLEVRRTRARHPDRTETGKANNLTENFATQDP